MTTVIIAWTKNNCSKLLWVSCFPECPSWLKIIIFLYVCVVLICMSECCLSAVLGLVLHVLLSFVLVAWPYTCKYTVLICSPVFDPKWNVLVKMWWNIWKYFCIRCITKYWKLNFVKVCFNDWFSFMSNFHFLWQSLCFCICLDNGQ